MEVEIGIAMSPKEMKFETDEKPEAVIKMIDDAVKAGGVLWLPTHKGMQGGIPAEKIAYVEIHSGDDTKRVGFAV